MNLNLAASILLVFASVVHGHKDHASSLMDHPTSGLQGPSPLVTKIIAKAPQKNLRGTPPTNAPVVGEEARHPVISFVGAGRTCFLLGLRNLLWNGAMETPRRVV